MKKNASLARKVALSCRILAKLGLFKETTGHVSARDGQDRMLIRGRGPRETGLLFTKPGDILLADTSMGRRPLYLSLSKGGDEEGIDFRLAPASVSG